MILPAIPPFATSRLRFLTRAWANKKIRASISTSLHICHPFLSKLPPKPTYCSSQPIRNKAGVEASSKTKLAWRICPETVAWVSPKYFFPYLCSPKQGIAFPVTLCPCAFLNFGKTRLHQPGAFRMLINHVGPLAEITGKIEQKARCIRGVALSKFLVPSGLRRNPAWPQIGPVPLPEWQPVTNGMVAHFLPCRLTRTQCRKNIQAVFGSSFSQWYADDFGNRRKEVDQRKRCIYLTPAVDSTRWRGGAKTGRGVRLRADRVSSRARARRSCADVIESAHT